MKELTRISTKHNKSELFTSLIFLNGRIKTALLIAGILILQSCELFGQDEKPQEKSTEFVFTVDTLKNLAQFQINDLDVIDDTSFVITGFFVENNEVEVQKILITKFGGERKRGMSLRVRKQFH